MPTGYTADVQSGKTTEFRDFAMGCARAFGALITMRDDPADAPIPDVFPVSDYHQKAIVESQERLSSLRAMSNADKAAETAKFNENERLSYQSRTEETASVRSRYEAMLAKVKEYTPPSPDHVEFKQFMIEQLTKSIEFDCHKWDSPKPLTTGEWYEREVGRAVLSIDYHTKEHAAEVERTNARNRWIRQLRESLIVKESINA